MTADEARAEAERVYPPGIQAYWQRRAFIAGAEYGAAEATRPLQERIKQLKAAIRIKDEALQHVLDYYYLTSDEFLLKYEVRERPDVFIPRALNPTPPSEDTGDTK